MSVVILQDEVVHYEVLGRGRPLIFLHGWVGSWRYWIPTMQAASMEYRAYALDLWGFGDTAKNPAKYSLDEQCSLIEAFLEKMGVQRIALVGHGLGAIITLQYTLSHPAQVDRVLAVGLPLDDQPLNPRLRSSTPAELADWLLPSRSMLGFPAKAATGQLSPVEAARVEAPRADAQAIYTPLDHLQEMKLQDDLTRLQTPCLFVQGGNDPILASPRPEELTSLPESAHQIFFESSGHFPMLDETSKFNRLLVDFLALASGVSPRQLQLKEEWKRRVR